MGSGNKTNSYYCSVSFQRNKAKVSRSSAFVSIFLRKSFIPYPPLFAFCLSFLFKKNLGCEIIAGLGFRAKGVPVIACKTGRG